MTNVSPVESREQRIRERAYQLWIEEGCPHGRALDHWTKAAALVGDSGDVTVELSQPSKATATKARKPRKKV